MSSCWGFGFGVADATDTQPAMKRRSEKRSDIVKAVSRKKY
jgi:hypothetical protein